MVANCGITTVDILKNFCHLEKDNEKVIQASV